MKIQIISDIHLEFHADGGKEFLKLLDPSLADVLVVAGDLCNSIHLERHLTDLCRKCADVDVVYVLGNHEYYYAKPNDVKAVVKAVAKKFPRFHFLDNSAVHIGEQRFIGSTLWFRDENISPDAEQWMTDFQVTGLDHTEMFRRWAFRQGDVSRGYLMNNVKSDDIVVTHMMPSDELIHDNFKKSLINQFFFNNVGELLSSKKAPKLWIHGHTHASHDKMLGSTRVVCQPSGYPGESDNSKYGYLVEA